MRIQRIIIGSMGLLAAPLLLAQTPPPPNPVPPQFRGIATNPPSAFPPVVPLNPIVAPTETKAEPAPAPTAAPATPESAPAAKPMVAPGASTAPCVVIEKRGPETITIGQALIYEITVRNVGQVAVYNVRAEDELPAGTKFVSSEPSAETINDRLGWNLGNLEANTDRKIRVELMPGSDGEFRANAIVSFCAVASMRTQIVRPKLSVALSGPDQVQFGDTMPLQIQVSNPGTGTAHNVTLRVKLPAGLSHPSGTHIEGDIGTLAPGESKSIPLNVTSSAGGNQIAEVAATGDGGLESSSKTQVLVQQPMLRLRRTGPAKVMYRGEVSEEYEISNPGNAPAANVTVTQALPVGLDFVGASDGAIFDPVGRAVTWRLGPHAPGAIRTVVLKSKANAVGDLVTHAVAVADRGVEAKADGSVAVEGVPALRLEVADLEDPVTVDGELMYEIRVFNQGSCPCTGIRITCEIPDGLTALEATGPTSGRIQDKKVVFEPLLKLATKADAVFRVKVRGDQPADYRFKVQMNCEQLRLPVNKEESSRVYKN